MSMKRSLTHPDLPDRAALKRVAERLRNQLGAEKIIIYGSVARGEATRDSDIDLLVIAPSTEGKAYLRMARALEVVRDISRGIPLSPIVLTPEEVEVRLARGDAFLRQVLDEGVVL